MVLPILHFCISSVSLSLHSSFRSTPPASLSPCYSCLPCFTLPTSHLLSYTFPPCKFLCLFLSYFSDLLPTLYFWYSVTYRFFFSIVLHILEVLFIYLKIYCLSVVQIEKKIIDISSSLFFLPCKFLKTLWL